MAVLWWDFREIEKPKRNLQSVSWYDIVEYIFSTSTLTLTWELSWWQGNGVDGVYSLKHGEGYSFIQKREKLENSGGMKVAEEQ